MSPRCFTKLVTRLRREGAEAVRKGRPCGLPLEDCGLLVAAFAPSWRRRTGRLRGTRHIARSVGGRYYAFHALPYRKTFGGPSDVDGAL
jgi:hypothetical protein